MKPFHSATTPRFWECLNRLAVEVQDQAFAQYAPFERNPYHPSLRFKQIGDYWSVRVSRSHRALAIRDGDSLTWFWIGSHDEYERLLKG